MAGKFEVYRDAKGKYRFRLKAGNGQIIAVGEAYESMAACLSGIESIRNSAPSASVADLTATSTPTKPGAPAKPGSSAKHGSGTHAKAGATAKPAPAMAAAPAKVGASSSSSANSNADMASRPAMH